MTRWAVIAGIGTFVMLLTVWGLGAAPEVKPLPATGNLFGEAVRSKLATPFSEYTEAIWPSQAELEKALDRSLVPAAATEEAETWVKTMLKQELVPSDLKDRFIPLTRRIPFIPPDDVDYLVVRYQIGDIQVQIQEAGAYISILINPLGGAPASDVPGYIESAAAKYLNLPPEVLAKGDLKLKSQDLSDGGRLYYGTLDYQYEPMMKHRAWWNHSYLCSDGKFFSFHTIERIGAEAPGRQGATPGFAPRFQRQEPDTARSPEAR